MFIVLGIIGIIFMVTFIFIGVWSFIILTKVYDQLKYKNYLIEKINHNLSLKNNCNSTHSTYKKTTDLDKENLPDSDGISLDKCPSKEDTINAYDSQTHSPDKKEV